KAKLNNVYSISAPAFATVYNWMNKFKHGVTSCDAPRLGCPIEATTSEIDKVHDIVLIDRRAKELVEATGVSVDHKRDRVTISKQYLEMFQRNSDEFLHRFITVDKTWIFHTLASCDYFLFPNLKKWFEWFEGKRFITREQLIAETEAYFERLDKSYYLDGLKKLKNCWIKCIELKGDYVEK
ncbi:hypothetical protein ALC53_13149, partial [Atta colombica]